MRKCIKAFKTLLLFVKYPILKQPSRLSDEILEPLLYQQVHDVEKGLAEEAMDFISMMWARKLYFEAKKRNLLSHEQVEWCERVLFARQAEPASSPNKGFNDALMEVIRNRRSVRFWWSEELKENEFEQLIDAARWAPSSCNRQPWHFLLTTDKNKIKLLSEVRGQKFVANAPSCILVLINMQAYDKQEANYTPYLDAGVAIGNLLLLAHSKGLGACWVNFGRMEVTETGRKQVQVAFGIPAHYQIVSIIPIGKPRIIPRPPGRKEISNILHLEVFKKTNTK